MTIRRELPFLLALSITILAASAAAQPRARTSPLRKPKPLAPPPNFASDIEGVFFADALQELGPRVEVAAPTPAATYPTTAQAGAVWAELVSAETLEDEIKSLVLQVGQQVKSPATFRAAGHEQARGDLALLAALFGVIGEYDGDVRWRESAPTLSTRFARTARNCKTVSDGAYRDAQARARELGELVRAGKVDVEPEADAEDWQAAADRAALMERFELALEKRLPAIVASKAELSRGKARVRHEAEIVALLARAIQSPGYEFADDQGYLKYARGLEQAALQLKEAADQADLTSAQSAIQAMTKNCESCHADFRG